VCESGIFTEAGLIKIIHEAIKYLNQAELYEAANELYKLVLPIFEKHRRYPELRGSHAALTKIFDCIINSTGAQARLLGSYYRVGFYGSKFEEHEGKEYIYKEPKITRLVEIKDRLQAIFSARFGEENVKIYPDSSSVDRNKLDANLCYLQITSLDKYFEAWELKDRVTYYDQNTNLSRFIFETPFTLQAGKLQTNSLKDQHKRKTILNGEHVFPYVVKRVLVTKKEEINLSPIENSIENVESRTGDFLNELRTTPPNAKTLQSLLQGSLLLQVNVGPQEICKIFLGDKDAAYPPDKIDHLKLALREFLKACEDAILLNKTLIGPDQVQFHKELEAGYKTMKSFFQQYL